MPLDYRHSGYSDPALGLNMNMYMNIIVKQIYWYISQILGEHLQDHWSPGFFVATDILGCILGSARDGQFTCRKFEDWRTMVVH